MHRNDNAQVIRRCLEKDGEAKKTGRAPNAIKNWGVKKKKKSAKGHRFVSGPV